MEDKNRKVEMCRLPRYEMLLAVKKNFLEARIIKFMKAPMIWLFYIDSEILR